MNEVSLYKNGVAENFFSVPQAIRRRSLMIPQAFISVVFSPKESAIAQAETSDYPRQKTLVAYFDINNAAVDTIKIALNELRKSNFPISCHVPINRFSDPRFLEFGLELAENHELLNGLPPLFLINGLPKRYRKRITQAVDRRQADAIFNQNVS